jgi:Predicted protein-tyrosine phosphatase
MSLQNVKMYMRRKVIKRFFILNDVGIVYLKIQISDDDDQLISKFFKEAFEFIDRALESNKDNTILIHCARGMSRSVTITVMFLMKKFHWDMKKVSFSNICLILSRH